MFRPHKMVRNSRVNHWIMTYIEMCRALPPSQRSEFDRAFRRQLYEYAPIAHDKKIIQALTAEFPRLGKLLGERRKAHGKGKG